MMQSLTVERVLSAPIDEVWALYTDHRGWAKLLGSIEVTLDPEGIPAPNGVGCIRQVRLLGKELVAEEVTVFEPPTRMKYRIVRGGGPIRDHDGEVLFAPCEGGTKVTWRVQFDSPIPGVGALTKAGIRLFFLHLLGRMDAQLRR